MHQASLGISEFGDALLRTGDLDPVYVALHNASLDSATLSRLCLAYWCFYHLGMAAQFAEIKNPKKYWDAMMTAAINESTNADGYKPWPRGAERRHYRGAQAVSSMASLISRYKTPEQAVEGMVGGAFNETTQLTYGRVAKFVQQHRGFGDWIAFKIADMAERVLGYDVDFSDCHLGIYKDPRQGAALALHTMGGSHSDGVAEPWKLPLTDQQLQETVTFYVGHFSKYSCFPKHMGGKFRKVNVQEVETVFCKWKSHVKGHYPVGKDTHEIIHGLEGWGDLANELRGNLRETELAVNKWEREHG